MKLNRCRQIAKKYPVTRLFVTLLVLTIALGTHTLLTASSLGQPLFEQGTYEKLQKSSVDDMINTLPSEANLTENILGISIVTNLSDVQQGDTVTLSAYGQFVNGIVPVTATWMVDNGRGEREIIACQMQKICHYRVRTGDSVLVRAFVDAVSSEWVKLR